MMKVITNLRKLTAGLLILSSVNVMGSVADQFTIPAMNANGVHGATMPYTRYDCNESGDATLGGGATLKTSPNWDAANKATQASRQAYVNMPVGGTVAWTLKSQGDGLTVRYTIKDNNVGGTGKAKGYATKEGELVFKINGQEAGRVDLTSYYMYQYFSYGSGSPSQSSGDAPCFCFDEKHVRLNKIAQPGDVITVECTSGEEVGVDFIELEVVPEPLDPNDDANGRQVFDVTAYGAEADNPSKDNRSAFESAFNAASAVGGIMFIPEGTWYMGCNSDGGHGILSLSGKNVKVMGAGIWHTNIQFTGWEQFGGGISGGNPSNTGGRNVMDNIEWCHMYINSNLSDRHGENAVYKCFMDIWCEGSVIHDVWEQHFECGFWFGDYNSNPLRRSEVKVVNCRIRDNYADGVNFCVGTSNSAVYNCSVRNNGDDGLACWDNPAAGSQSGNTFCYNTIDYIWRAGGIAIYGGTNQRVYNNYICDMFMASGIHMNDIFSRGTVDDVVFEENYLVRCGTLWESWGRDYAAIDLEGTNVATFRNNYLYECPAEALRVKGGNSGVTIDGLFVNGAGISHGTQHYSASEHSAGLGNVEKNSGVTINNMQVVKGSVPQATVGAELDQYKSWPWWDWDPGNWSWVSEDDADWAETPDYPLPEGVAPLVNPFETLEDYNLVLQGIDWTTQNGSRTMYDGEQVKFRVRIDNTSKNSIPADTKVTIRLSVDGKSNFSYTHKGGFEAGNHVIVEFPTAWTADKGQHTFTATIDPAGKLIHETDREDNSRVRNVNVNEIPEGEEPEIDIDTHSGSDMGVVKVYFENLTTGDNDEIKVGDKLRPHAIVANYGSTTIKLGSGQGFLWALGGSPEYNTGMLWNDEIHEIGPGEWIDITPNGGGNQSVGGWESDNTYIVKEETVSLWGRMDSPGKYNDDNTANNSLSADFTFPKERPVYNENPDKADNLETGVQNYWPYDNDASDDESGFDLVASKIFWQPNTKTISAGQVVNNFKVVVSNNTDVALSAGKNVKVTLYIDNKAVETKTYTDGISGHSNITLDFDYNYTSTAGAHTIKAVVANVKGDADNSNNTRERTFNAEGENNIVEPAREAVNTNANTGTVNGVHFEVLSVKWFNDADPASPIRPGDKVRFTATILNNGTERSADNTKHGIQLQFPDYNNIIWCDTRMEGSAPGERFDLTSNGGNPYTDGCWVATEGIMNVTAWFNDTHNLGDWDAKFTFPVEIVSAPVELPLHENPTGPDNTESTGIETISSNKVNTEDIWYSINGYRISEPTRPGVYIHNGRKIVVK